MGYKEIVEEAYSKTHGLIGQNKDEIIACAQFIESIKPQNILEIGSQFGGTFYIWCGLSSGTRISVDLPYGPFGGVTKEATNERNNIIKNRFNNVYFIEGDSHKQETVDSVSNILKEDKVDFLFIDADHTYEGVKSDYTLYKKFVKIGGYIGFHDINIIDECQVDRLWNELKGEKIEFNFHQSWVSWRTNIGGIGVIKNEN